MSKKSVFYPVGVCSRQYEITLNDDNIIEASSKAILSMLSMASGSLYASMEMMLSNSLSVETDLKTWK